MNLEHISLRVGITLSDTHENRLTFCHCWKLPTLTVFVKPSFSVREGHLSSPHCVMTKMLSVSRLSTLNMAACSPYKKKRWIFSSCSSVKILVEVWITEAFNGYSWWRPSRASPNSLNIIGLAYFASCWSISTHERRWEPVDISKPSQGTEMTRAVIE